MKVLCLEDGLQFRLLAVACGDNPGPWLSDFLAPERLDLARYIEALREIGRPWRVVTVDGPDGLGPSSSDADALAVEHAAVDDELLDRLPGVKTVVLLGREGNPVTLEACERRGIVVRLAPRATTSGVADHTLMLLLVLARRLLDGARLSPTDDPNPEPLRRPATSFEEGGHPPTVFNWLAIPGIRPLAGRRFGVLGAGEIGGEVLHRAAAFDMELAYCSRHRQPALEAQTGARPVSLEELPEWADVVSLHVTYHPMLHHVVGGTFLRSLGSRGLFINTSRGRLVDHAALVEGLWQGTIAGAGLDVFETEPLPSGDPLRTAPHLVLTPHVGGGNRWELVHEVAALVRALEGQE